MKNRTILLVEDNPSDAVQIQKEHRLPLLYSPRMKVNDPFRPYFHYNPFCQEEFIGNHPPGGIIPAPRVFLLLKPILPPLGGCCRM